MGFGLINDNYNEYGHRNVTLDLQTESWSAKRIETTYYVLIT